MGNVASTQREIAMEHPVLQGTIRLAVTLVTVAALWGCGQGDDKAKTEKKAEPAPPKAAPTPAPKAEAPKAAAPKASAKLEAEGWTLLGKEQANRKGDSDRITADPSKKGIRELRLVVEGGPLEIESMTVTFRNDKQFTPTVKQNMSANSTSASIDLPGEKRNIKHVDLTYKTGAKGAGKATVMVYGR
jgi:hypothetical protein